MGQEIEVTVEISSIQKMNGSAAYTPAAAYAAIASQTLQYH